jgi:hypothetical protein
MRQLFHIPRRIAPGVVLTFTMTLLAAAAAWAQNLVVHEVRQEAGTMETRDRPPVTFTAWVERS